MPLWTSRSRSLVCRQPFRYTLIHSKTRERWRAQPLLRRSSTTASQRSQQDELNESAPAVAPTRLAESGQDKTIGVTRWKVPKERFPRGERAKHPVKVLGSAISIRGLDQTQSMPRGDPRTKRRKRDRQPQAPSQPFERRFVTP